MDETSVSKKIKGTNQIIEENCELRKNIQILKAHCSKYQGDILKLKAENVRLRNEKQSILAFFTQKQLQQSEINIQLMNNITRDSRCSTDVSSMSISSNIVTNIVTPRMEVPPEINIRKIQRNDPNETPIGPTTTTMKNGRPRRMAAPRNLCEKNMKDKMRQ